MTSPVKGPAVIAESGVSFLVDPERTCQLDQLRDGRPHRLKTCEFVTIGKWQNKDALLFVEAKSSSPHPENSPAEFDSFLNDVCAKFAQSLALVLSVAVGRHTSWLEGHITSSLLAEDRLQGPIVLIFVLPGHPEHVLDDLAYLLTQRLERLLIAMDVRPSKVFVLNHRLAERAGLVA